MFADRGRSLFSGRCLFLECKHGSLVRQVRSGLRIRTSEARKSGSRSILSLSMNRIGDLIGRVFPRGLELQEFRDFRKSGSGATHEQSGHLGRFSVAGAAAIVVLQLIRPPIPSGPAVAGRYKRRRECGGSLRRTATVATRTRGGSPGSMRSCRLTGWSGTISLQPGNTSISLRSDRSRRPSGKQRSTKPST